MTAVPVVEVGASAVRVLRVAASWEDAEAEENGMGRGEGNASPDDEVDWRMFTGGVRGMLGDFL